MGASVGQALNFHAANFAVIVGVPPTTLSYLEGVSHCQSPPSPGSLQWSLLVSRRLLRGWFLAPLGADWWWLWAVTDEVAVLTTLVAGGRSRSCYQGSQQLVKGVLLVVKHLPLLVCVCHQQLLLFLHFFCQHLLSRDEVCKDFLLLVLACYLTTQHLILLHCSRRPPGSRVLLHVAVCLCSFNSVSLLVTTSPLSRSTGDSRTIRAWAKSCTDSRPPCHLAKNFRLAWVLVSCSLKASLKIWKKPEGEDHWEVGLSLTSSSATPSRWKIRVSTASLSVWPLTALSASEIQSSSTRSSLVPPYLPYPLSHGTDTRMAGVALVETTLAPVVSGCATVPSCPKCTSKSFSLLVRVAS